MKETVMLWVLGLIITLVLGAYGYATKISNDASAAAIRAETTAIRVEDKVTARLDRFDEKLDKILDRLLERSK